MLFETTLRVVTVIVQFQSQYLKNVQIFGVNVHALHVPIKTIHKYGLDLEVRQLMYLPTYHCLLFANVAVKIVNGYKE